MTAPALHLAVPVGMIAAGLLAGCASPTYVDKGEGDAVTLGLNDVTFQVHESYKKSPPDCVAVLPFTVKSPSDHPVAAEDVAKVRQSFYAHLSVQSKRTVKLERVDHELAEARDDRKALGERLKCGAVIEGQVSEYGNTFLAVYSRVAVGIEVRMIRVADNEVLWEGSHVAVSHGGSIPLDPVGLAMGMVDAASNMRDEQVLRVTDDVARRLVSTIPDNRVAALDDPGDPVPRIAASDPTDTPIPTPTIPPDDLALSEKLLADGDLAGALNAVNRALAANPTIAKGWFVKGRILMLEQDYAGAEPAIVKAVAMDRGNTKYLNALGAINAANGKADRALAAYRMALSADPADGFAWYNTAVIHYNQGNTVEAADGFYAAGLSYVKAADYVKAERALTDLNGLAKTGLPLSKKVKTLEDAIAAKTRSQS